MGGGPGDGASGGPIAVRREADGHVVYLRGDVDAPVIKTLEREPDLDGLRVVAVDVGGLNYIDSSGLAWLARWASAARSDGRPAEIRGSTPRFQRVLELAGLDGLFVQV
jgi:anti-anti-sigma factor